MWYTSRALASLALMPTADSAAAVPSSAFAHGAEENRDWLTAQAGEEIRERTSVQAIASPRGRSPQTGRRGPPLCRPPDTPTGVGSLQSPRIGWPGAVMTRRCSG